MPAADANENERIPVKPHAYGMRLLDFLEQRWPDVHRAYFRRLVLAEMVKVNRIIGTPYTTLRHGDVIDITRPPGEPPPRPKARLLHSDEEFVVLDKAAGQSVEDALSALGADELRDAKPVLRASKTSPEASASARSTGLASRSSSAPSAPSASSTL